MVCCISHRLALVVVCFLPTWSLVGTGSCLANDDLFPVLQLIERSAAQRDEVALDATLGVFVDGKPPAPRDFTSLMKDGKLVRTQVVVCHPGGDRVHLYDKGKSGNFQQVGIWKGGPGVAIGDAAMLGNTMIATNKVGNALLALKLHEDAEFKVQYKAGPPLERRMRQLKWIAVHPNGRWIYALSYGSHELWLAEFGGEQGLAFRQCIDGKSKGTFKEQGVSFHSVPMDWPTALQISPDGKDLYVACFKEKPALLHFRIQPDSGFLTHAKSWLPTAFEEKKEGAPIQGSQGLSGVQALAVNRREVIIGGASHEVTVLWRNGEELEFWQDLSQLGNTGVLLGHISQIRMSKDEQLMAVTCQAESRVYIFRRNDDKRITLLYRLDDTTVAGNNVLDRVSDAMFSPTGDDLLITSSSASLAVIGLQRSK